MSKLELHHKSVMCEEVLSILNPTDDCIYVDGTLGAGGHTRRILEEADCKVIGCLLYTSPSPRDISGSRMPSSA